MSRIQEPDETRTGLPLSRNEEAECLFGLSLSEAFRRFVLEDAQVAALGKSLVEQEGRHAEVFTEGQYPGLYVDFGWSLDVTAEEFAFEFVRPFIIFVPGPPLPEASPLMRQVSAALVEKLQRLRALLVNGDVIAYGTFERTGNFEVVHRLQWARRGLTIDVQSGDLLREVDRKPVVQWSGLLLEAPDGRAQGPTSGTASRTAPAQLFHVNDTERDQLRSTSTIPPNKAQKTTPIQASIVAAIQDLWPEGIPPGKAPKVRDQEIIDWQTSHGLAIASSKTIRRHLAGRTNPRH